MSYDFNLWTSKKIAPLQTPIDEDTHLLITADYNLAVQKEDMPEAVIVQYKTIKYLSTISVHDKKLRDVDLQKITAILENIALQAGGIIEDPQKEFFSDSEMTAPSKHTTTPAKKLASTRSMSVIFYIHPEKNLADLFPQMIDLFEKHLPSALPQRYGPFEPAQHRFEKTGRADLIDFLQTTDSVVWVPKKPFQHLFISNAHLYPPIKMGFRCNRIELVFRHTAYQKASFNTSLLAWTKDMALLFNPFYGEITPTNSVFTTTWWWRGLPTHWGEHVLLGPEYVHIIEKDFDQITRSTTSLSLEKWSSRLLFCSNGELMDALKAKRPNLFARKKIWAAMKKSKLNSLNDYRYAKTFPFKKP